MGQRSNANEIPTNLAGEAYVIVNDEPAVNISSLNSRAGYHDSTPVQLKLRNGDVNTITFGFSGEDGKSHWKPRRMDPTYLT